MCGGGGGGGGVKTGFFFFKYIWAHKKMGLLSGGRGL